MPVVDMEMSSTAGRLKKRIDIRTGGETVVIGDGMMRIEIIIGVQGSGNNSIFCIGCTITFLYNCALDGPYRNLDVYSGADILKCTLAFKDFQVPQLRIPNC